jgi:esterase/lipase
MLPITSTKRVFLVFCIFTLIIVTQAQEVVMTTQVESVQSIRTLEIPTYIFSGKHDLNSPSALAHHWLDGLEAPRKEIVTFENSAHFLM